MNKTKTICNEYQREHGGKEMGVIVKVSEYGTYHISISASGDADSVKEKLKKAIALAERKIDETRTEEKGRG